MTPEVTLRTRYRTRSRTRALLAHLAWPFLNRRDLPPWWRADNDDLFWSVIRVAVIALVIPCGVLAQEQIPLWGQQLQREVQELREEMKELRDVKLEIAAMRGELKQALEYRETVDSNSESINDLKISRAVADMKFGVLAFFGALLAHFAGQWISRRRNGKH